MVHQNKGRVIIRKNVSALLCLDLSFFVGSLSVPRSLSGIVATSTFKPANSRSINLEFDKNGIMYPEN
jgi:hypothetical protein